MVGSKNRVRMKEQDRNFIKKYISDFLKQYLLIPGNSIAKISQLLEVDIRTIKNYLDALSIPQLDALFYMRERLGLDINDMIDNLPSRKENNKKTTSKRIASIYITKEMMESLTENASIDVFLSSE